MKKGAKIGLGVIVGLAVVLFVGVNIYCRNEVLDFVHFTSEEQQERWEEEVGSEKGPNGDGILFMLPEDAGLAYEEVTVTSSDGMTLNGWYMPSANGAAVMLMHGMHEFPYHMMEEAGMLQRYGFGALLISVRDHNFGDGDTISFGCDDREMADLEAWYQYLIQQDGIDPDKIGILGQSMGGLLVIQYAQKNENIKAVVAHSTLSSVSDTVETAVAWRTGLPLWAAGLLAGDMMFWMEQELDCDFSEVSAKDLIGDISPRPVFIMHAENDEVVAPDSGELLMAAAGDPKTYWVCAGSFHHECDTDYPQEFEERIIGFFSQYLLDA
jgi:alpha-beta hydrolase superfamily lysophospholipase